jgi:hypothetical protein
VLIAADIVFPLKVNYEKSMIPARNTSSEAIGEIFRGSNITSSDNKTALRTVPAHKNTTAEAISDLFASDFIETMITLDSSQNDSLYVNIDKKTSLFVSISAARSIQEHFVEFWTEWGTPILR